jgi:hypothetical protein
MDSFAEFYEVFGGIGHKSTAALNQSVSIREFLHAQPRSDPHALAACSARHREWLRSIQPEFLVWIP